MTYPEESAIAIGELLREALRTHGGNGNHVSNAPMRSRSIMIDGYFDLVAVGAEFIEQIQRRGWHPPR